MHNTYKNNQCFVMLELILFLMSQPLWVLKTAKDRNLQRLFHMSADLARQIGTVLENSQNCIVGEVLLNIFLSDLWDSTFEKYMSHLFL